MMFVVLFCGAQQRGSLFIIGGGDRPLSLMKELVETARLGNDDYIVVLTMSSGVPEESYETVRSELSGLCANPITGFHFTKEQANERQEWIDSVRNARLIYVTGGDQNRFMEVVRETALYRAMHDAYNRGGTISGTSAGAAIMSQVMITGSKVSGEGSDFRYVRANDVKTAEGMGFLTSAVIDQHFIRRSRYNRLMGVLADNPAKLMIGIDESTALVVNGKNAKVVGENQVVVLRKPKKLKVSKSGNVTFRNARLSLVGAGESFRLK